MSEGTFAPFFRVAGSGYAIDEKGTPEYNQLRYGWQSQWRVEDDELERHLRSKNPCVVYDLPRRRRNAADVVAACERAVARLDEEDAADATGGGTAAPPRFLWLDMLCACLLYTSPSPRDRQKSRMPSSA